MSKDITANTTLSHYRIVSKIGAGGMGEVWLAEDTRLKRKVALKLLPAELTSDADRVRRFEQEAQAASALNHPNILTIYEIGEINGTHYIATEYIEGETLRHHIQHSRGKLREILETVVQVASALSTAHQAGIIHRDIKPENVMLRPDGIVKVLDFGLAKLTEKAAPTTDTAAATKARQATDPGTVMGTVQYMSPEQARGREVDARSDIFSLGIVLYELVAGRAPFVGESSTDVLAAILDKEPPPLARFADDLPPELQRIVTKCLRKERDERYQTMKDVLLDVKELRDELALEAKLERSIRPISRSSDDQETRLADAEITKDRRAQATSAATAQTTSSAEYLISEMRRYKRGFALAALVMLISALGLGYWYFSTRSASTRQIESIAVMPFVNESGNQDTEYLSDGMTETLIGSLSQVPNLNVKSRSSVFRYKGKETNAQTIGKELNVQAILNGRVVQRGEQLTLSLELVDTATENAIWSESYNRKQADIVTLQNEIARDVSGKLKAKLSGVDEVNVGKTATTNPEAYQLYLKGRFYWNKRTSESLKLAVEFFDQAIAKDPNYALAYSGLAESYVLFPNYSAAMPMECMPKAKAAALRAIELDDGLAEAHVALGIYFSAFSWDQPAAEKEFRRAIELNPTYPTAHQQFSNYCLLSMGRFDEALAEARRAEELDPLSPVISADVAWPLYFAKRYNEAVTQLKGSLKLDPNFSVTRRYLATVYHTMGMFEEAIAQYRNTPGLNADPYLRAMLARSLAKAGQRAEAVKILGEIESESADRYVPSNAIALALAALGEKDKALVWLEKDVAERTSRPTQYSTNPIWDDLRDDPRFAALIRKVEQAKLD